VYVINNKIITACLIDGTFVGGTFYVSCSYTLVTGRVGRLIRHAAYTARHTLCMSVRCIHSQTYLVYVCILRSWIAVIKVCHQRYSHTDLVSLQCVHTRKNVSSF